jgi:uncharacterized CHY-type Zn-finger protein
MSTFDLALKQAVRTGQVVVKCGVCSLTMRPEDHKEKAPCAGCAAPFDPLYLVPEHLVLS